MTRVSLSRRSKKSAPAQQKRRRFFLALSWSLLLFGMPLHETLVQAVPTATFRVSTFSEMDKGEPKGTLISSKGEVSAGRASTRLKLKAAMIWSSVRGADGTVYFGTGDAGLLYAVKNNVVRQVADLKTVLISSLAQGRNGKLLAGTMPGAKILEIDPRSGKWTQLAKLPARHVWALLYDGKARSIYAASGSPGKIYRLPEAGGAPAVYYDPKEQHLLCLAQDAKGALLAGSSDRAIVYRITAKNKGLAIHDFDATELRKIVIAPRGELYVAVNRFQQKSSGLPRYDPLEDGEAGTALKSSNNAKTKKKQKVRAQELRPGAKEGKGALYRIAPDGRTEQLFNLDSGYFTDLQLDTAGTLWAADGTKGKVYLVDQERTVFTAFDFPERQVLSLAIAGPEQYLGTGDAGAIYRVSSGPGPKPYYLSQAFDAKFVSRWGNLHYFSSTAIRLESRSGNTAKPDHTWSGWTAAKPQSREFVRLNSPAGRYIQLRMTWPTNANGFLRSFTIYYRPQNQKAEVTEITFEDPAKDKPKTPKIKIKWKVENPDNDALLYRLYYREEMGLLWRRVDRAEPIEKTEFEWDTEPIPDGYYRLKVDASDEKDNPTATTLVGSLTTERILIDNRKPEVTSLVIRYPFVSGLARDSYSPIKRMEYSLDGKRWRLVDAADGILDSVSEAFRLRLPDGVSKGTHIIAVRAFDEADNMGVSQIRFNR